jgi:hypothetical protein
MIERTLRGAFRAIPLAAGTWQLTNEGATEVYLAGVESDACVTLAGAAVTAVSVAWSGARASVKISAGPSLWQFTAQSVVIHEPRPRLYDDLPLVVLNDAARRFWRRVFFVSRMPGGRRLLRWIARRTGGG